MTEQRYEDEGRRDDEDGTSLPELIDDTARGMGDDEPGAGTSGEPVGRADVEADKARTGADTAGSGSLPGDSDTTPVGAADADEDARRSGADDDR